MVLISWCRQDIIVCNHKVRIANIVLLTRNNLKSKHTCNPSRGCLCLFVTQKFRDFTFFVLGCTTVSVMVNSVLSLLPSNIPMFQTGYRIRCFVAPICINNPTRSTFTVEPQSNMKGTLCPLTAAPRSVASDSHLQALKVRRHPCLFNRLHSHFR